MNEQRNLDEKLDRLVEMLVEETLKWSDEEILAQSETSSETEQALRSEIDDVIAGHRRKRLLDAKKAVAASRIVRRPPSKGRGDLRGAISRAVASNDASITLAARNGRDVPDADLEGLADDLRELGFEIDREEDPDAS
jgi:hypothetical protein